MTEHQPSIEAAPFACGTCGRREASAGGCPTCDDPFLDLRSEEVRLMLVEDDQRKVDARFKRALGIGLFTGILIVALVMAFTDQLAMALLKVLPLFGGPALVAGGITLAVATAITRLFPADRHFLDLR